MNKFKLLVGEKTLNNDMKTHYVLLKDHKGKIVFDSHLTSHINDQNTIESHFFGIEDDLLTELETVENIEDLDNMWNIELLFTLTSGDLLGNEEEIEVFIKNINQLRQNMSFYL